jgi:hypothetical protein
LVVLPAGAFLVNCSGTTTVYSVSPQPGSPPTATATQAIYTSSISSGHDHTFSVRFVDFSNPPAGGVSGETSLTSAHTHHVFISMEDLSSVELGNSVQVTTTTASGHSHVFTFVKVVNPGRDGGLVTP